MSASIELSIVIPTYRKPDLLQRTLDALRAQIDAQTMEVVVVDDGSQDGATGPLLERYAAEMPLIEAGTGANEGRARARNRGWRRSRGRAVLFLDDDIVLEPGALSAHLQAQRDRPAAWLGEVVTAAEIVDSALFDYLDTRGAAKCRPGSEVPARYFLTQNVSLPRAALERVGGFDEEFGAYGFEDMEIAFRLEDQAQLAFFRLEGARGQHVHHHTLAEYLEKKRICGAQTLPRMARLHPDRIAEMGLDVLFGRRPGLAAALRLSWALRLPGVVEGLLESGPGLLPRRLRHRLFDYLVVSAYAAGLRRRDAANMT